MKILEKIRKKQEDMNSYSPITIAFIGDSITQGCFDCYVPSCRPNGIETIYDYSKAYSTRVREILNLLYPKVQINIINSGISGDNAMNGKNRFERDVLSYNPDLIVISYGANDVCNGIEYINNYITPLRHMFEDAKNRGIETIFLTQNYMATETSDFLSVESFKELSKSLQQIQNGGLFTKYFEEAKKVCKEYGVKVCDVYSTWDAMNKNGVHVTELLANRLNHPVPELHYYTAIKLIETMLQD